MSPVLTVYVFWNYHEAEYRQYDFTTENRNLGQFLQAASDAGLFVNLRIGPFVCAEWTFGGLPVWLRNGMHFRTNDTQWEYEMETFVTYLLRYVEPFLARNGGPIILAQIENEYDNMEGDDAGNKEYVQWCGALTQKLDIGIPWVMCSSHDAPQFIINTCNGFYWSAATLTERANNLSAQQQLFDDNSWTFPHTLFCFILYPFFLRPIVDDSDSWIDQHETNFPNQPSLWTEGLEWVVL